MTYENSEFFVNEAAQKFELTVNGGKAFIDYKLSGQKMYLLHTEVPPALEGQGVATALVEKTLQYMEAHHWQLVPQCAFVQSYVQKHPAWKRLVKEEAE